MIAERSGTVGGSNAVESGGGIRILIRERSRASCDFCGPQFFPLFSVGYLEFAPKGKRDHDRHTLKSAR